MKIIYLFSLIYFFIINPLYSQDYNLDKINIKVLLEEVSPNQEDNFSVSCDKGLSLIYLEDCDFKKAHIKQKINIAIKNGKIYLDNNEFLNNKLKIAPNENAHLKLNGNCYQGYFFILKHKSKILLINSVPIEDYTFSVLKTESWPGWPLEVNKAFAIACRSYVVAKFLERKITNLPYHVKNSNAHQTYQGHHTSPILRQAVDDTKGIILCHKNKPILAMFDACCGGVIPAKMQNIDFIKCPYLARKEACNYCNISKSYNWIAEYDKIKIEEILKKEFSKLKNLKNMHVVKKDKAGIVQKVQIKDNNHTYYLGGKKIYSLFKDVISFHFDIENKNEKIIFKGKGLGHHLGLCQWGAKNLVDLGWSYKSILNFYYPGTHYMKLKQKTEG